jgi:hypothetical protein
LEPELGAGMALKDMTSSASPPFGLPRPDSVCLESLAVLGKVAGESPDLSPITELSGERISQTQKAFRCLKDTEKAPHPYPIMLTSNSPHWAYSADETCLG